MRSSCATYCVKLTDSLPGIEYDLLADACGAVKSITNIMEDATATVQNVSYLHMVLDILNELSEALRVRLSGLLCYSTRGLSRIRMRLDLNGKVFWRRYGSMEV